MQIDLITAGEGIGGLATAATSIYAIGKHLIGNHRRKKATHRQAILDEAKEEAQKIVNTLESKVKRLEVELRAQELSISKDLEHFKETYSNELKNLGEKIEMLRADVAQANSSIVGLLTKLVDR